VLKQWAGSEGLTDTDRAAADRVLDLVAVRAATSDSQQGDVASADSKQHGSSSTSGSSALSPTKLSSEVAERCEGTAGDWCGRYLMQEPIPAKARGCTMQPPLMPVRGWIFYSPPAAFDPQSSPVHTSACGGRLSSFCRASCLHKWTACVFELRE